MQLRDLLGVCVDSKKPGIDPIRTGLMRNLIMALKLNHSAFMVTSNKSKRGARAGNPGAPFSVWLRAISLKRWERLTLLIFHFLH